MDIKIRLLGQLKHEVGKDSVTIELRESDHLSLQSILETLANNDLIGKYMEDGGEPRHDIIVFVNGKDYRVYSKNHIFRDTVEVSFIPISHGGIELQYVTWNEVDRYSELIASKITKDGYKADVIVGIMRGGIVPARIIADYLGIRDLGIIEVMFYQRPGETRHKPVIRQPLTLDVSERNVLIVDDVSDTGKSLQVALSAINLYGPEQVKTATLYIKPWSTFIPDYYGASSTKWIVFPWEKNEVKRELG